MAAALLVIVGCSGSTTDTTTTERMPVTTTEPVPAEPAEAPEATTTTEALGVTTTTSYDRVAGQPPEGSTIAVLGCSNTWQHAIGYTEVSEKDDLRFGPVGISGKTLRSWARSNKSAWDIYYRLVPEGGYTAAWFQICLFADEHDGTMSDVHKEHVTAVVEMIRARSGDIPIYLSPANFREPGVVCNLTGAEGVTVAAAIADWGTANLDNVHRGPDTGPLSEAQLVGDGCHLNPDGELFVGEQLVEFFDQ